MCLDNGSGGVISDQKNILLLDTVAEKLTAVRHKNGIDYWIIVHKYFSDAFYAYQLSNTGIINTVISHIGSVHNDNCIPPHPNATVAAIGYMKASPNGKKLAVVNQNTCDNIKEIFDFNDTTGIVSNWINLKLQIDSFGSYGTSFSPDNSKLYISDNFYSKIYQYDLLAGGGQADSIKNSKITISNLPQFTGEIPLAIQIGPDKKIYVARADRTFLAVINNPNIQGLGCNFQDNAVSLNNKTCNMGLPNFIDSYDYSNTTYNCETGINEVDNSELTMKIYPNPSNSPFDIQLPTQQGFSLSVIDITGKIVYTNKNAIGSMKIDASSFSSGVYFVKAINEKVILTGKLIKE